MTYVRTVPDNEASGRVRELYDRELTGQGYVSNYTRLFSLRPEVYDAWGVLKNAIRGNLDPRRYELVTVAAAAAIRCTYCMVAHGAILRSDYYSADEVAAIARDFRSAGLSAADVAIMAFAEKVALEAYKITEEDVAGLRRHGLSDEEVFDVSLAAAARCFFSKTIDAMGAEADEAYGEIGRPLLDVLSVGRPFPLPRTGTQ